LGRYPLNFSSGDWAKQANGSAVVSYGDTAVLVTACMSKKPSVSGYFPLIVEYQEKTYAMGKIPGGYLKREGRPKDAEILTARLIDRPIRPLFPKGLMHEVQVVAMVLSSDAENDPDVLAVNGASLALMLSDIPYRQPIGAVRVSKVDGKFVINPSYAERESSSMDLVVVGRKDEIVMLEGAFKEISEEDAFEAIKFAQAYIREIIQVQEQFVKAAGRPKKEVALVLVEPGLYAKIKDKAWSRMESIYGIVKKEDRENAVSEVLKALSEELIKENAELTEAAIASAFGQLEEDFMREKILTQDKRPDSRKLDEIRPIDCKVGILARTHGSAVFTRGQTQSLAVTTLGSVSDAQTIEALEGEKSLHFMLHYAFPPFSVGEVKMMRGPSRRDIGHGALAEKALAAVVPGKGEFPYTIRIVSEILESNGSSSMATVCASSLSLMDAGVPIKAPAAGIALGLVRDGDKYKILTDIAGVEDHCGDMDFKVAGTRNGITAIQLDMKIDGISHSIIKDTLARAKDARLFILDKIAASISGPRSGLSRYAPKIRTVPIDPDRIGTVIGPGGKMIRRLSKDYNVTIDIDDDTSTVSVVADDVKNLDAAIKQIVLLTRDIEVGDIFEEAKVTRLMNFGAFCEIVPGKQGLVHISELAAGYVKNVEDVVKIGDILKVRVVGIDHQGRINLSAKAAQDQKPQ